MGASPIMRSLAGGLAAWLLAGLIIEQENLLDGQAEVFRDVVGQPQRGIVLALFQEDDGLAPDTDQPGQLELGKVVPGSQFFDAVIHFSFQMPSLPASRGER